jgi:hypothetical protein
MPADLSSSETALIAEAVLRMHADFRQRHGLPPLPSAWSLVPYLTEVRARSSLIEPSILRSPRRGVVGTLLNALRRLVLLPLAQPILHRQTAVNRDLLLALDALLEDRKAARAEHRLLAARIYELERRIAPPPRRSERVSNNE